MGLYLGCRGANRRARPAARCTCRLGLVRSQDFSANLFRTFSRSRARSAPESANLRGCSAVCDKRVGGPGRADRATWRYRRKNSGRRWEPRVYRLKNVCPSRRPRSRPVRVASMSYPLSCSRELRSYACFSAPRQPAGRENRRLLRTS